MKEYLERILHKNIEERPYQNKEDLPLRRRNAFELTILTVDQQEFLLAAPLEDMNLTELRKCDFSWKDIQDIRVPFI